MTILAAAMYMSGMYILGLAAGLAIGYYLASPIDR